MDDIGKKIARRDFLAGLVLDDEIYLPVFVRAEHEVVIAMAATDRVAAARAVAAIAAHRAAA